MLNLSLLMMNLKVNNFVPAINTETDFPTNINNSESRKIVVIFVISGLQDTTLALDFRVTALEENGGSEGNSSIAELEVRVEALEGTAADHETRISTTESGLTGRCDIKQCAFRLN